MNAVAHDPTLTRPMSPRRNAAADRELLTALTTHVGDEERLLDRAERASSPSELVIAPVQLHRRNLQRRLREAADPRDAFEFTDPESTAEAVLARTDEAHVALDRVDRLSLLRSPTDTGGIAAAKLPPAVRGMDVDEPAGDDRTRDARHAEQVRSEVESMTNFHPARIDALRDATGELRAPIDAESDALVARGIGIETALRERTDDGVSRAELLRRATRRIDRTDGAAWGAAFPSIDRVSFVGVSSVSAPYVDLLHAILAATDVAVEVHLRPGTGPFLEGRLPELLAVDDPGREVFR